MWMATKEPAVVIPPSFYKLNMSTTDYLLVLSILKLLALVIPLLIWSEEYSQIKYLHEAIQSVITTSAFSSTFSHLWNSDTCFFFKLSCVKPCDILMLIDVCAPWFDSHTCPTPSDARTPWKLPADFVHPAFLLCLLR
ncbi:19764_t:CDS:2 [Rhizophagus irregularis]|nr:19764_t:CDS:2 [Rhizophagus irregularis]